MKAVPWCRSHKIYVCLLTLYGPTNNKAVSLPCCQTPSPSIKLYRIINLLVLIIVGHVQSIDSKKKKKKKKKIHY